MTNERYKQKRRERKTRNISTRFNHLLGMGVRLSGTAPDTLRYRRVKSAKRFIKLTDKTTCITIGYECFGLTGYGCKDTVCIHRKEETLLERYGDRLCWNCQ